MLAPMATPLVQQVVVVPASIEQVMAQLMSVAGADSYAPVAQSYDTLTLQRRRIPVWAIVLAIIFFPIGLLFLLVKDTEVVQLTLVRVEGGTQVTIAGRASTPLQSALQYALSGYQATAAGLPRPTGPPPAGYPQPGYGAPPPPPSPPEPSTETQETQPLPTEPPSPAPPPPAAPAPGGIPGGYPAPPPPSPPGFGPPGGEPYQPPTPPGSGPPGGEPWKPPVPPGPKND
jgi:hypothetical protein